VYEDYRNIKIHILKQKFNIICVYVHYLSQVRRTYVEYCTTLCSCCDRTRSQY